MRPFEYQHAADTDQAVRAGAADHAAYLAGGTTLVDLMKLDVMRPTRLVDINTLSAAHGAIRMDDRYLHIGALARMEDVALHADVRTHFPAVAQSLSLAASTQLRHMASIGGNLLQRTRCTYFRDTSWTACNKRTPGSGCAAMDGVNRMLAVLGTSDACIASYPGDLAAALVALETEVMITGAGGARMIAFAELHRPPGATPEIETSLRPGDLITGLRIARAPYAARSLYLKVRDRESYEFALASAAVALHLQAGVVQEARIGLGGVASTPWRARKAEAALVGQRLDEAIAERAAIIAYADAKPRKGNEFKPELGRRTLVRALLQARDMKV